MVSLHILHALLSGLVSFVYVFGSDKQSFKQIVRRLLKNALVLFGLHWLQEETPPLQIIQF